MIAPIMFEVEGIAMPQGSKTRMPNGAMLDGRRGPARTAHRAWRTAVHNAATHAAGTLGAEAPLDGPLTLTVEFRLPMPKSRRAAVNTRTLLQQHRR